MTGKGLSRSASLLGLLTATAFAQTPVGGDGRLFDANPALDGNRFNSARPATPLMSGNLIGTGNARFGQSLRVGTPVGNPISFSSSLPSSRLGGFLRDSFSVADAPRYQLGGTVPYFDPSATTPTAAFLRRQGAFQEINTPTRLGGGGITRSSGPLPGQLDYARPFEAEQSFLNEARGLGPADLGPTRSSIFGADAQWMPREVSFAVDTSLDAQSRPQRFDPTPRLSDFDALAREPGAEQFDPLGVNTERGVPQAWRTVDWAPANLLAERRSIGAPLPGHGNAILATRGRGDQPEERDPLDIVGPGRDLFTDMQLALELERDPDAQWFDRMRAAQRRSDDTGESIAGAEFAAESAAAFADRLVNTPIRSFADSSQGGVNVALLEAEELLAERRFYDAAERYDRAYRADPTNPLALFGRANALLGAGEYRSAVRALEQGLERFPEMARFRLDLADMFGGGETVDIRRAGLRQLLEGNESPELRFLLGYLELNAGMAESGRENLERAAQAAPPGSLIRRYPAMLAPDVTPPTNPDDGGSSEE